MTFQLIQLIPRDATDGHVWPVAAASRGPMIVEREPLDGEEIMRVQVKSAAIKFKDHGRFRDQFRLPNLKNAFLYVTDARAIFAMENFNPGGGWSGTGLGLPVALAANAIGKARYKEVARATVLTGQIRYQWMRAVKAQPRWGIVSQMIMLFFTPPGADEQHNGYYLELWLPGGADWASTGQEITRRAASFKLREFDVPEEARPKLKDLAEAPRPVEKVTHIFPWHLVVGRDTAYPAGYLP